MKLIQQKTTIVVLGMLLLGAGSIFFIQKSQIGRLRADQESLGLKYRELSSGYTNLLASVDAREAEIARLRKEAEEVPLLRNRVTQLKRDEKELSGVRAENERLKQGAPAELAGYIRKEQMEFAGFGTPENSFQSSIWARANSNYTNWIASLAPDQQKEELAEPRSLENFQRSVGTAGRIIGTQVMARKVIGDGRVELKVRLDYENAVAVLVFPMDRVGNEWKLGDEIKSYSKEWDQ